MTDVVDVVNGFFGALAEQDLEGALKWIAPDAQIHEPAELPHGGEYRGPDGFRELSMKMFSLYDFELLEREDVNLPDGLIVRMWVRFTGRESGRSHDFSCVEYYKISDGLIQDVDVYYKDPTTVAGLVGRQTAVA